MSKEEMSSPSHNSLSPSSTISELDSPLLTGSTRRPRTRRKRPNQIYDEATALLSTAYPTIFSSSSITKTNLLNSPLHLLNDEASHLLPPFQESDFFFSPSIMIKSKYHHLLKHDDKEEENGFGIFNEEIELGIDSFMGKIEYGVCQYQSNIGRLVEMVTNHCSMGLKKALRENDDASLCRFATVDFEQISPAETRKVAPAKSSEEISKPFLMLNYDRVLQDWSDKESPFSDHTPASDLCARWGEIDLLGESGMREASVLRYKQKRKNRLFSNSRKIRYQVRKLNANQRPRMKGRFVRRSNVRNLSGLRLLEEESKVIKPF